MRSRSRIVLLIVACLSTVVVAVSPSFLATPGGVSSSPEVYDCGGGASCHDNPSTATLTMWASKQQVEPGGEVTVLVNVTGGQAVNVLGTEIISARSRVPASIPTAAGWIIDSDPGGTKFNYWETTMYSGLISLQWTLDAPTVPGQYTLYAMIFHGTGAAYSEEYAAGVTFLVGNITTTGPTVIITAPTTGSTVKGVVPIQATVLGSAPVKYAAIRINGMEIGNLSRAPFAWSLESTNFKDGTYTLNVTAVDVNGQAAYHQVTITISNAAGNSELITWVWTMAAGTVAILAWIGVLIVVALMIRKRHVEGG